MIPDFQDVLYAALGPVRSLLGKYSHPTPYGELTLTRRLLGCFAALLVSNQLRLPHRKFLHQSNAPPSAASNIGFGSGIGLMKV